ncbi:3-deoxy-manno-octulosonate cytidylyltransferase [Aureimonas endophytica]|uniref:3-deoxy-manno-octulosonate cytidylyltransferase n=1 Tax=Aureimonas endophytica TaxID=2027858 RepID=A0A916ZDY9_9HYPH|nr:3-deoxy-manno-octulosonate cytidylyltransferase [Aureimonas endophytica]
MILVANSEAVDLEHLMATAGPGALFVFFNKTYKILAGRFERPALLVARSSEAGANIVYRREVERVVEPFAAASFAGILNLKVGPRETFSRREEFGPRPVGHLDLSGAYADFYPSGHVATSGFALGVWLAEQRFGRNLLLAGFSARRSLQWKLFRDHDWSFEQTALRLLERAGRLSLGEEGASGSPLQRFARRFPEIAREDVGLAAAETVADRLAATDAMVDRLLSLTRLQALFDTFLRRLKPPTRKERLAARQGPRE